MVWCESESMKKQCPTTWDGEKLSYSTLQKKKEDKEASGCHLHINVNGSSGLWSPELSLRNDVGNTTCCGLTFRILVT